VATVDLDIVAVMLCMAGSAFFSASETALSSLPITRLEALRERCGRLTRLGLDRWSDNPQELLITILIGNNLVNVLASALATRIAYRLSSSGGLAGVVGVMTLVILIFGEITPKTLAQTHAQWLTARVAPVLYLLDVVLRPANKVLGILSRLLSRGDRGDLPVTEEDLLFMLRLAHRHAQLLPDARLMIESVLRLQQTVARQVMVPRTQVITVDASWTLDLVKQAIAESGHSRFPVVNGSPDRISGILHAKQLLDLTPDRDWTELVVEATYIPATKPLPDLLHELRSSGRHLVIVLDEYGGFSGVVSLEDAIELVVGEIEDEFDQEAAVIRQDDGWLVPGHLSLRRLERLLQRTIDRPGEIDSVGGVVASLTGADLTPETTVEWQDLSISVAEVSQGRPTRLLIREPEAPEEKADSER
jgi:putative hemolysin